MNLESIYLDLAVKEAFKYQLLTYPNPAVGAVVLHKGKIVAIEAHKRAGTSHAEVLALLLAYENISKKKIDFDKSDATLAHDFLLNLPKGFFSECDIYVTLEPCSHIGKTPSCANLIANLKLNSVTIGALDPISSHSGGIDMLKNAGIKCKFLEHKGSKDLLEPFVIWQNRAFVIFKLAQTINAQIGGGYISSKESLKHTHKIREVSTTLLIGGNTVRVDRPTLDCRFIDAKAPDIKIYSKKDNFDREIALFSVSNRSVEVIDSLDFLNSRGLVLVEGGEGMLNAIKDKIDWMLIYQSNKIALKSLGYYANLELEFLDSQIAGNNLRIFSRVKR